MRVAVTGGSGKLGRVAIEALREAGHSTVNLDIGPGRDGAARFVRCDAADFGQVMGALSGIDARGGGFDAVLHLAGIPAPGIAPDEVIFRNNTLSTYNVLSAAARLGIGRVVWASSETLLGLPLDEPPLFAPLDETHPSLPNWSYSLSKHLGEAMAEQFVRWRPGMSIVSLRFSNIIEPHEYAGFARFQGSAAARRFNLWSYVDVRDAAQACRLAVEAPIGGHEVFLVAAADTCMRRPSAELMAEVFPAVPLTRPVSGRESLQSTEKAKRMLGYHPRHSWTDAGGESGR